MVLAIHSDKVGGVFLSVHAETGREAGRLLPDLDSHAGFPTLENDRLVPIDGWAEELGPLDLHEGAKLRIEILQYVVTLVRALDGRMAARDRDVISDPDIGFLTPPNLQVCLVLCVYDVEHLLWDGG